jgi:glycosyltransferase involved in cell wall biosynthesis
VRVLIDGTGPPLGAAGLTRLRELASTLPALRPQHEFVFVVQPSVASAVREAAPDIELRSLPSTLRPVPLRLAWQYTALPGIARRFRPDVVFAPFNIAPGLPRHPRPPLALMISNLAPYSEAVRSRSSRRQMLRNRVLRALTNRSIRRADSVFVLARQALDLIHVDGLRDKAVVLPLPPVPKVPPAGTPASTVPGEPYILVVGDLYSYKGVETVIEAAAKVAPPPLVFVCGHPRERGYARGLEGLARHAGIAERVRFTGSVPHDAVLELMRDAAAVVAASRFEHLSRIPGEAMSLGAPVVACDTPSNREACGEAAVYYPDDDASALAEHVERLLEDPGLRAERARAGRAFVNRPQPGSVPEVIVRALERLAADRARA